MCACVCVAVVREEKDGDVRRLLRRVNHRAKSIRRQRSKSAMGHLQSVHNERSIDDAVAKAAAADAAEKIKLSNDELHTTSSPDLDKCKGFASLSKLLDYQKYLASKGEQLSASRPADEEQQRLEVMQRHTEHARKSPTVRNQTISSGSDRARSKNSRPLAVRQHAQHTSHQPVLSSAATTPCASSSVSSRSESVLLFPGHSRENILKRSRNRLASTGSSGLHTSPTARSRTLDHPSAENSAAAYLGSGTAVRSPNLRRMAKPNLRCWQRRGPSLTAEEEKPSGVADQERRPPSSLGDETGAIDTVRAESLTDLSPRSLPATTTRVPWLEFLKADHSYDVSPLSLSVQCGSDADDIDGARESVVVPTHRLTSRRVWNTNTCSWEDDGDSLETAETCGFSDVSFWSTNQDTRKIVFAKADVSDNGIERIRSDDMLWFANSRRNRGSFSESDIERVVERQFRKRPNIAVLCQPSMQAVRNTDVDANSKCDHILITRHSVIGNSYDEKLISRPQTVQSFDRARSCPEMTSFTVSCFPCRSFHVGRSRKISRFVSSGRRTVTKSSRCQKRVNRVFRRRNLSPPLFASWPGKGDIVGSMLAYESSV